MFGLDSDVLSNSRDGAGAGGTNASAGGTNRLASAGSTTIEGTSNGGSPVGDPSSPALIADFESSSAYGEHLEHALVVAYPHIRSGFYVSPASTAQASNGVGAEPTRGIPCGGRIQYDPAIDIDSLNLTPAGKAILRALQIYDAYVGDYSGAISLYADNSPEAQAFWDSIGFDSYELLDKIDLAGFRVLEIGTMHVNGNG